MFPASGQNVGEYVVPPQPIEPRHVVVLIMNDWFVEYQGLTYQNVYDVENARQFVQAIKGTNDRVGCALVNYTTHDMLHWYLVCNYPFAFVRHELPYATGVVCRTCPGKCSDNYRGLCSNKVNTLRVCCTRGFCIILFGCSRNSSRLE